MAAFRHAAPLTVILACLLVTSGPAALAQSEASCDTAAVVARALPATVNITVAKVETETEAGAKSPSEHLEVAFGSGAIVDPLGVIVTNKHVIKDAARIWITFANRSQVEARLIAAASLIDLAVLKVDGTGYPTLRFGNSDAARIGQSVIAVGNPLGLGTSVSTGVVSAVNRNLMRSPIDDYIQTDASINPGNSGGPLLDCSGDIVGIDTALVSNNKLLGSIGLGFALPANDVSFVLRRLLGSTVAAPTWVGLDLQDLTAQLALTFRQPNIGGAIITAVDPNSPAAHAALVPGDIITALDGKEEPDARAILRRIVTRRAGETMTLTVWHQGRKTDVTLRGQAWPHMMEQRSDVLASPASLARAMAQGVGLRLTTLTPADRRRLGIGDNPGVLIDRVVPGSQAEAMGLKTDDVIEQVGDRPATSPADVITQYNHGDPATGEMQALLVHDKKATKWVTLFVGHVDASELLVPPPTVESSALGQDAASVSR